MNLFSSESFPSAEGQRLPWNALPAEVLRAIEDNFGATVTGATTKRGGFSPGIAARVRLSDGRTAFVKAVGSSPNPHALVLHRREAKIAAELPGNAPVARFLFAIDEGDWVALAFEDIPGDNPAVPWDPADLDRVLRAISDLSLSLTPSPIAIERISEDYFELISWAKLFRDKSLDVGSWARTNIRRLMDLESRWEEAAQGETLLHADLRADNILLTPNRVVFVDWPHASIGAPWLDLLFFLPSVAMQRGPMPWVLFDGHPLGRSAPPERVDAVLAALAGFFLWRGFSAAPPGLPGLPAFARGQGVQALAWLRHRLDEDP